MISPRRVYLDNNATTPVLPEVMEAMLPWFGEHFGNASSIHQYGQEARSAVERARESVAGLIGCRASEIVFTSGGTEADNLAIAGLTKPGDHVITSSIEHHAVLHACKHLQEAGREVTYLPVDGRCLVDPEDVRRALRPQTKLISVMTANNETGVVQSVEEIGKMAAEAGVAFHTDAVQSVGKISVDVNRIGCHALSLSGHKLHAPQGVGALYLRKGTKIEPLFYGGRHERSRRAGTENVPGIVGLGKAAELAMRGFADGADKKMGSLRDHFQQRILAEVDEIAINGDGAPRVPNTTNISFQHIEGEAMVIALDLKGLAISTGAACASGTIEPSHVLTAMGLRGDRARGSIRFSLGKQNSAEDVEFALELLMYAVGRLRDLSPSYKKVHA
ncbi:MAG TPA: cysteine desulfurase family protein [Candidatus Sulfotelmatobacter sp.]